jgi:hypothetical protein
MDRPVAFPGRPAGQQQNVRAGRTREVAIVSMGPDQGRDQTEDVGLPEHEQDETRQRAGGTYEDEQPGLAGMSGTGPDDGDELPAHEDDARRGGDTGSGEQNP